MSKFRAGRAGGLSLQIWVGRRGYAVTPDEPVDQGLLRPASARGAKRR